METMQQRGTERLVLAIGQISASPHTVWTPSGSAPVNDVTWTIGEDAPPRGRGWRRTLGGATQATARTVPPTVTLTVTVSGPGWQHVEQFAAATPDEVTAVRAKVTQARMLALRAVVWSLHGTSQPSPARAADELVRPAG